MRGPHQSWGNLSKSHGEQAARRLVLSRLWMLRLQAKRSLAVTRILPGERCPSSAPLPCAVDPLGPVTGGHLGLQTAPMMLDTCLDWSSVREVPLHPGSRTPGHGHSHLPGLTAFTACRWGHMGQSSNGQTSRSTPYPVRPVYTHMMNSASGAVLSVVPPKWLKDDLLYFVSSQHKVS